MEASRPNEFIDIAIELMPHAVNIPKKSTSRSAGHDLYAANESDVILLPNHIQLISTGLKLAIPNGFEGQIRSRSGLTLNYGVVVLGGIGTIDSDYRGEIKVVLSNFSQEKFIITRGMRVAQLIFAACPDVNIKIVDDILKEDDGPNQRLSNGFGSSGL